MTRHGAAGDRGPLAYKGVPMPSRRELERIARRYDTAMSRAMLRALGAKACPRKWHGHAERRRYRGLMWCFRNHGSPMDRGR